METADIGVPCCWPTRDPRADVVSGLRPCRRRAESRGEDMLDGDPVASKQPQPPAVRNWAGLGSVVTGTRFVSKDRNQTLLPNCAKVELGGKTGGRTGKGVWKSGCAGRCRRAAATQKDKTRCGWPRQVTGMAFCCRYFCHLCILCTIGRGEAPARCVLSLARTQESGLSQLPQTA